MELYCGSEKVKIYSNNSLCNLSFNDGWYVNRVPISIDTDGSIYNNGLGYINGYRLNSSGGLTAGANSSATGFIPAKKGDIFYLAGAEWFPPKNGDCYYSYISFFDENFTKLAHINQYIGTNNEYGISNMAAGSVLVNTKANHSITTDDNGITTFLLDYLDSADFSYIRISAICDGADMVVTVNGRITND